MYLNMRVWRAAGRTALSFDFEANGSLQHKVAPLTSNLDPQHVPIPIRKAVRDHLNKGSDRFLQLFLASSLPGHPPPWHGVALGSRANI